MATLTGSTWWCELCRVEVWVCDVPKWQRHMVCRKWMVRVRPRAQR
jgi:hypothetical protein